MALTGKVALVTGASRGIGKGIAIRLARDGATVAVHYGSSATLAEDTVKEITKAGGRAFSVQGRLDRLAEIDKMFSSLDRLLVEHTGEARFDILVNNAGIDRFGAIEEITAEIFEELFDTNVKGTFFVTQRALSRMRNGGRIINLSSGLVRIAVPRHTIYTMGKGAIDQMTRVLAQHLGPRGITVNSVAPGAVQTDMTASWLLDEAAQAWVKGLTALGRIGEVRDIADIVAFVASDEAGWMTGNWVDASGGQSL
jgi:NAD(P)-dependent dehydrogenase (short-subunit alcohol dehydrogenase family)